MTTPMNVLFITADQWRGDCLSAIGHPCLKTPNLDGLAADGIMFKQHYAQATPCGPSRASLYTGMYLQNHRSVLNGTPLDARHTNVALEARKAGYDPVLFGYTDTSADPRVHPPADPALHTYGGVLPGMTPIIKTGNYSFPWRADLKAKGYTQLEGLLEVYKPKDNGFKGDDDNRGLTYAPARFSVDDSLNAFLTNELIKHLSVCGKQPWFAHLSLLSPHPPFVVPEPYHAMYDPAEVPDPIRGLSVEAEAAQHPYLDYLLYHQTGWGIRYGHDSKNNLKLTDLDMRQARATYYGMMSEVDFHLGRLFDYLKETGAYDNTLVVFTSDHGEQLGDHWQYAKYAYFDQSFHVPLIIRDPRSSADCTRGHYINQFTENIDITPTILDVLDTPIPHQCDGKSLLPFLQGKSPLSWREEAHWEFDFRLIIDAYGNNPLGLEPNQCAVNVIRGERYKYIHFTTLPSLLFDIQNDPGELNNLADDPDYLPIVLEYAQKLLNWRMNHDERALTHIQLTPDGVVKR